MIKLSAYDTGIIPRQVKQLEYLVGDLVAFEVLPKVRGVSAEVFVAGSICSRVAKLV